MKKLAKEYLRYAISRFRRQNTSKRILALRGENTFWIPYKSAFLEWMAGETPEAAALFDVVDYPTPVWDIKRYRLFIPWLQDPLRERFPKTYRFAKQIERVCEKNGIPVVNPLDHLSNSIKSVALPILAELGLNPAKVVRIENPKTVLDNPDLLPMPCIIRENMMHSGPTILVEDREGLNGVPWEKIESPIAVGFVDTRGKDGLYRKYRYMVMGNTGAPRHMIASSQWRVKDPEDRVKNDVIHKEEVAYMSGDDPNHDTLVRAARAMGFDCVAFDYSYTRDGQLVVWEPNPLPVSTLR